MYLKCLIILLSYVAHGSTLVSKCDQTPPLSDGTPPSIDKGLFHLVIEHAAMRDDKIFYTPDQTYVLTINAANSSRPFRWFMITAEDPAVDNSVFEVSRKVVDVGSLKTLDDDSKSRYSERCASTVENIDSSDKTWVEIHWVSPKQSSPQQQIRIRAMVAENREVWYTGDNLTILLNMEDSKRKDSPPLPVREVCTLCSEARYEIIFKGQWSRVAHPRYYPNKPDENGYSHLIGASHGNNFTMWQQGAKATKGLQLLAEEADVSVMEREIIDAMVYPEGTRTLIRGKRRHHPYMSLPSQALFRTDRIHHMFSVAVAMRPSPDWFLGIYKFELCNETEWLDEFEIPLYPWDAGTMDGVSYESPRSMSQPGDNIERVEVGSFNRKSPFYQLNLNDLQPFAKLQVRRLDVYPLIDVDCSKNGEEESESMDIQEDAPQEPIVGETKQKLDAMERCDVGVWGEWSPCFPREGVCGPGSRTRIRSKRNLFEVYEPVFLYPRLRAKINKKKNQPAVAQKLPLSL
ncbi:hypothetical protein O3G_MSEX005324 [Manduca sexta]|uniref:Spondin-1 n=1 Tax=Manduca sexta TaxID=7130 RepID=A0A921YZD2_MANSE|nr:hypothetical protein O3G_MSEX005324 [Manduca sexta]